MDNHLEELLVTSRQWSKYTRGSEVVRAAIEFLCGHFQIDAGFVAYERTPRPDGADYLRAPHRWFTSWGFQSTDKELRTALADSIHFQSHVRYRQWFDAREMPGVWTRINQHSGIQQVGIWLVSFDDAPVAVFVLARKSLHVDDSHIISLCMAHISVLVEVVLQRRVSEEMAVRDPLTGLLNRRGFLQAFDRVIDSQTNQDSPLVLGVLDIDDFKKINDQFGHLVGDSVIIKIGNILATQIEACQGVCCRIGGDEFVVLGRIGGNDANDAAKKVSEWFLELDVTVSVGCAIVDPTERDFDAVYHIADEQLYGVKAHING